jgi:hypothetical protein
MAQTGTEKKKNYNTITDSENIDEASLLELKNVQDDHDEPEGRFTDVSNKCALRHKRVRDSFTSLVVMLVDYQKSVADHRSVNDYEIR